MLTLVFHAVDPHDDVALRKLVADCDVLDLVDTPYTPKLAATYGDALRHVLKRGVITEPVGNLLYAIVVMGYEPRAQA